MTLRVTKLVEIHIRNATQAVLQQKYEYESINRCYPTFIAFSGPNEYKAFYTPEDADRLVGFLSTITNERNENERL